MIRAIADLKEIYEPDGMIMIPVYSADGQRTDEFAVYEILERFEKHTDDCSGLYWFPHIAVHQRVLIQEWRGTNPEMLKIHGEPSMQWLFLPEESKSLPFVPKEQA